MIEKIKLIKPMRLVFLNKYEYWIRNEKGKLLVHDFTHNTVVTAGLNDCLDKWLKGSSYTAAWYMGLKGSGTIAAGDTMGSHAGWSEVTGYDEANRQTVTLGSVAAGAVNNSAAKCVFTASTDIDVYGIFVTTGNGKSGTTGTLLGAADFTAFHSLADGYTLTVQANFSVANA